MRSILPTENESAAVDRKQEKGRLMSALLLLRMRADAAAFGHHAGSIPARTDSENRNEFRSLPVHPQQSYRVT